MLALILLDIHCPFLPLSGPVFFCKSKKQALVATSAMHAETRAFFLYYQLTLPILQLHLVSIEL